MFSILGHPLGDDDAPSAFAFDDETALPGPVRVVFSPSFFCRADLSCLPTQSSKPMTTSNLHLLGTKRRELLETERTLVNRLIILQEVRLVLDLLLPQPSTPAEQHAPAIPLP